MGGASSTPRCAHVGVVAHLFGFGLERVCGDGEWVERLPLGWGWAMSALVVQRGMGNGSTASLRLGMGYGIGKGGLCAVRIECRMVPWYMLVDKDGGWF